MNKEVLFGAVRVTPLYLAVVVERPEYVRLLVEAGADAHHKNKDVSLIDIFDLIKAFCSWCDYFSGLFSYEYDFPLLFKEDLENALKNYNEMDEYFLLQDLKRLRDAEDKDAELKRLGYIED